jgi:hypothetical protein
LGAGDGSETLVVIVDGDVELVVGRLDATRPDLAVVDTLARLQLAARRLGWSVRLRHPCAELCRLLELVGLAEVLGLPLEAGRQAERREQLRVQEVVEPGDPVA